MKYNDKYSSASTLLVLSCLRAMASFQTKPAKPILRSNRQFFHAKHRNEMGVITKGGKMVARLRVSANPAAVSDFPVKTLQIVISRNAAVPAPPRAPSRVHALMCLTFSEVC